MEGKRALNLKSNVKIESIYSFTASPSFFSEQLFRSGGNAVKIKFIHFCRPQETFNGFSSNFEIAYKKA